MLARINFQKDILPHLIVLAIFYVLIAGYFKPAVFDGKVIQQNDITQWRGAANEVLEYKQKTGKDALWTNSSFSGMPSYVINHVSMQNYHFFIGDIAKLNFPYPISTIFISLVCFYILMLSFGISYYFAAIGAIAFTFSSFTFISLEAGHNSKILAMAYAPLVMAGIVYAFKGKRLLGFAITAIGMSFHLSSGHYQITYYLLFLAIFYGINELIKAIQSKKIASFFITILILAAAVSVGVGTNAPRLLVTLEYMPYSMRGKSELKPKDETKSEKGGLDKDYVFSWSHQKMETFTFMIPAFFGGGSQEPVSKKSDLFQYTKNFPYYWGDMPFTAGPIYMGAIICFLFVLAMFLLEGQEKWWLLAAAAFGTMLSWGRHFEFFNYLLFDIMPGFNKFRAVTMSVYLTQLALPIGAVLVLQKLNEIEWNKSIMQKSLIAFGLTGGLCLLFYLVPSISGGFEGANDGQVLNSIKDVNQRNFIRNAMEKDRENMLQSDAIRSFFLIAIAAALLLLATIKKIPFKYAILGVGLLITFDLWTVNRRYLNEDSFQRKTLEANFVATAADLAIKQDKSVHYRVLNLQNPFNDARTSFFHHSIGGYSPVKVRRYQDLIENNLSQEIQKTIRYLQSGRFTPDMMSEMNVLNMLNAKYLKFGEEANAIIQNPAALGNAWFVKEVKYVNSPDEEIEALTAFNPKETAIIDKNKFSVTATNYNNAQATIQLTSYSPVELIYESNNSEAGLAVFSEIYYPEGWIITIDGQPATMVRANYTLRALEIPAGKHTIRFSFEPSSYSNGNKISAASSIILLLTLIGSFGWIFYEKKNKKNE
jgi:hypothetical protein